jgi:DNA-3-methyladenine glycosylase II
MMKLPYDPEEAVRTLTDADPVMAGLIERAGPLRMEYRAVRTPFEALTRAIIYQQLSGKAAATIYGRVEALFPDGGLHDPALVRDTPDEALRAAGMSRAKVAAVKDLAAKTLEGVVPGLEAFHTMDDAEVIARLITVRGIGTWTAEMFLFRLGRPDVFPVTDLGVRRGFMLAYGHADLPEPSRLLAHGERWRPFRSAASWYLWRAVDLHRAAQTEP